MILETIVVGPLEVNCHLLGCGRTREALVIDPGDEPERILEALARHGLALRHIVLTHAHFDHLGAAAELRRRTGADVLAGARDAPLLGQLASQAAAFRMPPVEAPGEVLPLREGDVVAAGDLRLEVIETPGHSPGGISLHLPGEAVVFTGDTLLWGSVGRTDLPGSDHAALLRSLRERLAALPDGTRVLPGHYDETSIGLEKEQNPFLG